MLTAEFGRIVAEVENGANVKRIVLMCAEAVPWRCHRQLLADALLIRSWTVRHIMDNGCHEHKLTGFAQVEGMKIFYRDFV